MHNLSQTIPQTKSNQRATVKEEQENHCLHWWRILGFRISSDKLKILKKLQLREEDGRKQIIGRKNRTKSRKTSQDWFCIKIYIIYHTC